MTEFKRIMIPLDGSRLAEKALPVAKTLAKSMQSHLFLIRVVDFPDPVASAPVDVMPGSAIIMARDEAIKDAEQYLEGLQKNLVQQGFKVITLLGHASPAQEIIDMAYQEKIDLIVMSTHGRGGLARWAFGSVADKVMRYGPCPVLLMRQNKVHER